MMRVYEAHKRAEVARRQMVETATELQARLRPRTLAGHAWEEVKDRSGELADDAVEAVKARPVAAASVLAAFTLFLARQPIKSGLSKLFSKDSDPDNGKYDGAERRSREKARSKA